VRQNGRVGWVSGDDVLRLPVRLRGIELGRPVDLIFDRDAHRVLGVEVLCGDDERRFLPFAVATVRTDELEVRSALVLLEEAQLAFYTSAGRTLRSLRGATVVRRGILLGTLQDVAVDDEGAITSVLVATADGPRTLDYAPDVELVQPRPQVRAAS
jgi:hypothetical protein